jgi:hypothetical protein
MGDEVQVPGADSPIESIRAIQQDRLARQAAGAPGTRKLLCAIYLDGRNLQVDARVGQETLLQVLRAAYMGARGQALPDTRIEVPESKILVP